MFSKWQRQNADSPPSGDAFERYAAMLRQYLARRVSRPEDIADLTQEVFELFVRRKERAEVVRDPLAYLFRIAFHVVGSSLAERKRSPVRFDSDQAGSDLLSGAGSSAEDAEELVAREDVRRALARIPENHRVALMLVEAQGLSYKEAARLSGFTPETISTYVKHGRKALRLALDGQWKGKEKRT